MDFVIRPTTEDDWESIRTLRLEMLQDTPMGFAETYETALTHAEVDWRARGLPPEQAVICREHGIEIVYLDTLLDSSTRLLQQFTDQDQHRQQGQQ